MKDPMKPFEGKVFTSVDEGYNVMVYRTPRELQERLLKLGKFFDSDGNSLVPYEMLDILEEKGTLSLHEKDDDDDGIMYDWSYRVEVH